VNNNQNNDGMTAMQQDGEDSEDETMQMVEEVG